MNNENEIKEINFRMDLLRENTELSLFLYDCDLKEAQWESIREYYKALDEMIYAGEKVHSSTYESKILSFVDQRKLDYHFAETIAKLYWENRQYEDVFKSLYSDSPKFKHLFNAPS